MRARVIPGTTSYSVDLYIQDTAGAALPGLAYNTASLTAYYRRGGNGSATAITLATLASATAAWSSGGFKEVDATNMPGLYRLDVPDAALAVGAASVVIILKGAASMSPCVLELLLEATPGALRVNKATAGAAGTLTMDAGAPSTTDFFKRNRVKIVYGTGAGQSRYVSGQAGQVLSVTPNWVTNPDSTSVFEVVDFGLDASTLAEVVAAIWDEARSGHTTAGTFGKALQDADLRAALWQVAIAEAYSTDGSNATPIQLLYEIAQALTEVVKSGSQLLIKKRDGTTTAFTLTCSPDADNPTSVTRSS